MYRSRLQGFFRYESSGEVVTTAPSHLFVHRRTGNAMELKKRNSANVATYYVLDKNFRRTKMTMFALCRDYQTDRIAICHDKNIMQLC